MSPTSAVFQAGYLPGLRAGEVAWERLNLGAPGAPMGVDVPRLTPAQMQGLARRVTRASREHLKTWPVDRIVHTLDKAIARLLDKQDPYRQQLQRWLPAVSGLAEDTVQLGLTAFLKTFRQRELQRFLTEDFANPRVLDAFVPRPGGGWTQAMGPELALHVWAGNVPALPLWSFVSGLLVKAGTLGKLSSSEPVFASVWARLLAEVEPHWADCFAVVWWPGGDEALERAACDQADVVLAYGGTEALQALQSRLPVSKRFLPHGHKLSFGLVTQAALTVRQSQISARQAALDMTRFDQQGCYSPQLFYVERGGLSSPRDWAQQLAAELAALAPRFARRALSLEDSASISAWRQAQERAALQQSGRSLLGEASAPFAVAFSEQALPLQPGPLNRCVLVCAVDHWREVPALVEPLRAYLQTAGVATSPEDLLPVAQALGQAGVTRVCALGAMTLPQAGWHHDGRFSLLDLVRMVDVESSAETAAEPLSRYED